MNPLSATGGSQPCCTSCGIPGRRFRLFAYLFEFQATSNSRSSLSAALVAWTLALLGVGTIADGLIISSVARVNGGTLCVLAVVVGKFFSDDFSFTVKGVVFIICGVLFLATNLMMSR